eukprot:3725852-Rhodomonas_salina.3
MLLAHAYAVSGTDVGHVATRQPHSCTPLQKRRSGAEKRPFRGSISLRNVATDFQPHGNVSENAGSEASVVWRRDAEEDAEAVLRTTARVYKCRSVLRAATSLRACYTMPAIDLRACDAMQVFGLRVCYAMPATSL